MIPRSRARSIDDEHVDAKVSLGCGRKTLYIFGASFVIGDADKNASLILRVPLQSAVFETFFV
jgi:hypothetical protein